MTVSDLLQQPCNNSDNINKILQVVNSLFHTCWQFGTSNANTSCWQTCYKMWDYCVCKNLTTCQQDVFARGLSTRLSLTTCYQVVELQDDNKLLQQLVTSLLTQQPCTKLSTSRWQLVNKLGTSSANTSCWQVVGTALLQVCCRFVTTCAFLRVYTRNIMPCLICRPEKNTRP
jgi:hypothetical protein